MRRILFYLYYYLAIVSKLFSEKVYMHLIVKAHKTMGVRFLGGGAEYIDFHSHLDPSGVLSLGNGCVISTNVIILTHDWSFLKKMKARGESYDETEHHSLAFKPVEIGEDAFIGAGSVILPGSKIGKCCIVGAGAVVKGEFDDYSVIVGSPARKIKDIRGL